MRATRVFPHAVVHPGVIVAEGFEVFVGLPFVGADDCTRRDVLHDFGDQRNGLGGLDHFAHERAATLRDAEDNGFVFLVPCPLVAAAVLLPADECLVHFNMAGQLAAGDHGIRPEFHQLAQLVPDSPRAFVRNAELPL